MWSQRAPGEQATQHLESFAASTREGLHDQGVQGAQHLDGSRGEGHDVVDGSGMQPLKCLGHQRVGTTDVGKVDDLTGRAGKHRFNGTALG